MGMYVRALTYMMSHGADGLRQVAEDAVLNANYVKARLSGRDDAGLPDGPCMHEALFDDRLAGGDRRHHARLRQGDDRRGLPPDDHVFPAGGARRDADRADRDRVQGASSTASATPCWRWPPPAKAGDVERFKGAPFHAPLRRLDETLAARKPKLRWTAPQGANLAAE